MGKVNLQIMEDDGPQPMRNNKPSEKNPNGADQFQSDHQKEYENYESQEERGTKYVDDHNAACPKMIDELQKRQSTARPSACITNARRKPTDQIYLDPNCPLCQKLKLSMERKKRMSRTKTRRDKRRRPEKKSRVKKPKPKKAQRRNNFKLSRIARNVGVQCYQSMNRGTEPCSSSNDGTDKHGISTNFSEKSNSRNSQAALSNPPESEKSSKSFMYSSQYPNSSAASSINSYNSDMSLSLNHEPMISS